MSWYSLLKSNPDKTTTEILGMYKKAAKEDKGNPYLRPAIGAALGLSAVAMSSPFVRSELKNLIKTRGKVHAADMAKPLITSAKQDASKVKKYLLSQGIDPSKARIAVTGAGGTGKTTFSKALATNIHGKSLSKKKNGMGIHTFHRHLDTEINRGPFGWDFTTYKPVKGTISEQTHLLSQSDPDNYDVLIHLEKPVDTVRGQLLSRGKGATQYEIENYSLLQENLRNAFQQTAGNRKSITPHIDIKIKPKGGFKSNQVLDNSLRNMEIDSKGMTRADKILTVTTGKPSVYRGIASYLRRDTPSYLVGGAAIGAGAGAYLNKEAGYRKVNVGGQDIELDEEIPLLDNISSDPDKARSMLVRRIRNSSQKNWSHPQVAIDKSKLDLSKMEGYSPTRLAIPLPGELPFTTSYRMGRLHAHERGPVYLVHEDAHAPQDNNKSLLENLKATISHTPEALHAIALRLKGAPEPVKLANKPKLKVLYIDETGAGHRAQSNNVVASAKKLGIDAEAIDWSENFGSKRVGKRYRKDYLNLLDKKNLKSVIPLLGSHIDYHYRSTNKEKLDKFLEDNEDSAIMLAHPLLEGQFRNQKRPISMLHTDPVKWPGLVHLPSAGKRQHVGVTDIVKDQKYKKELKGLAVSQTLLSKKLPPSGKIPKGKFNITVSGGGEGLEVEEMAREILRSDLPQNAQVHAVAGRNTKLLKTLERMAKKDQRLKPYGFAPLPSMMREADLNVIRAHGTSYAETLTSGKPAVYYGPKFNLVDLQGTLTRNTALHGVKRTKYPHAIGHSQIAPAVTSAIKDYKTHLSTAKKLKKGYGDPGAQAALGAVQFYKENK